MSRVAKAPVEIPGGVSITVDNQKVAAKGPRGNSEVDVHSNVSVVFEDGQLRVAPASTDQKTVAMAGTMRSLLNNMVVGVSSGFEKRLELRGVGYRAQAQGNKVNLTLGFSHPVVHDLPQGVSAKMEGQTEIIIQGADKQRVGQVAAEVRAYRPPEPYKGKGVCYNDEHVVMKEAKKK